MCDLFAKLSEQVKIKGGKVDPKKLLPWHFLKMTSLIFCLYNGARQYVQLVLLQNIMVPPAR